MAGCEAANYIAKKGIKVRLWEMRPGQASPVHQSADLAELVCSNSLKSMLTDTAQGLLKAELRIIGSLLLDCADKTKVPAGSALAVDRKLFSSLVTEQIIAQTGIELIRREITDIPEEEISIIATGPLTSPAMAQNIARRVRQDNLFFYDALSPSVTTDSLDQQHIYKASRYDKGGDDYINCPLTQEEYNRFYNELVRADEAEGHLVDKDLFFDGCMPIEVIARQGRDTLRYGPMRPVGLACPESGRRPYAVLQLRQEDIAGNIFGLVGFQTRLRWPEQNRVFRLIPALAGAEFVRYGVMHRNTYINSPKLLRLSLQLKDDPSLFWAGQITGVEGYMESAASGIIAGINAVRLVQGKGAVVPDQCTMIGALLHHITMPQSKFKPVNANFGLLPPFDPPIKNKKERYRQYADRAVQKMLHFNCTL